ncbi:MAG: phosphoribosylamine--glycine ligase [Bacteroidia bacterium]|jgi:phosphoribosylamine--glycine ligase
MNILLIGSGGREHAMAFKLKQSSLCDTLYIMPGNAGTAQLGLNVPINPLDFALAGKFCIDNRIELVVVGPEDPLVKGIRNYFEADQNLRNILFVGPGQEGAIMEGSKDWSKDFMARHQIPTAAYKTFTFQNIYDGLDYVKAHSLPVVLKADGLAAGKGVLICENHTDAVTELNAMIREKKFGDASNKVVVEEFLKGIELSVFVLTDGDSYIVLPEAKDYKRIGIGETGLNTGGMGAVSPVPFADSAFMQKVEERIIQPTIMGLKKDQIAYKGFIFIGLMKVGDEPYVIEYNCRMGDPETEAVLPRIESDYAAMMLACANGTLKDYSLTVSPQHAATVVLVSEGYPGTFEKGKVITNTENVTSALLFHAGTSLNATQEVQTNGGRVLAITALADSLDEAVQTAMINAEQISYDGKYYRTDIGFEFIAPTTREK